MASITIKNADRLIGRLNAIGKADLKAVTSKATALVQGQAKTLAPVDKGILKNSILMEVKEQGDGYIGRVYTNLQYAPFVEFGTGSKGTGTYPYDVKGLSLTYRQTPWVYTPDGGETFYRTNGQVAQPYMYPALKRNEKTIKKMFAEAVKENNRKGGNK